MSTVLYERNMTRNSQNAPYQRPVPLGADRIKTETPYGASSIAQNAIQYKLNESNLEKQNKDTLIAIMSKNWRPHVTRIERAPNTLQGRHVPKFNLRE